MDKPQIPPLGAVVMGAIQDRQQGELAKLTALLAIGQKLDQVLDELEALHQVADAILERERRR